MSNKPTQQIIRLNEAYAFVSWRFDAALNLINYQGHTWLFGRTTGDIELVGIDQLCQSNELAESHRKALDGFSSHIELFHNPSTYLICISPEFNHEHQVIGVQAGAIDVSHYKGIERDLKSLKQHAESILNAAGEGVYGINLNGEATFVNPAAERMTGWNAKETIGQKIHFQHHHSREDGTPYPIEKCPVYAYE